MANFKIVAAVDEAGGIGKDGGIPWNLRNDLSFFRFLTYGHHVVMGRKTFENVGDLEGRSVHVLSSSTSAPDGAYAYLDKNLLLHRLNSILGRSTEVWIAGGGSVYEQFIGDAEEAVISQIEGSYNCDTYFPTEALESEYERVAQFYAQGFRAVRYES